LYSGGERRVSLSLKRRTKAKDAEKIVKDTVRVCIEVPVDMAKWLNEFPKHTIHRTPEDFILDVLWRYYDVWRIARSTCEG